MRHFEPPKGTRDFPPGSMTVRDALLQRIRHTFLLHGFQQWDGPAFEHLETLTAKSSPDIVRELYAFKDKADRDLGLRFDLTTSLSRIIASNPRLPKPVKAWSFGKVWRYENTQKGRYREFLQMDADILGAPPPLPEAELLLLASSVLDSVGLGPVTVLLNDRRILDGLADAAHIPQDRRLDAFRSLDKLPKIGPEGVAQEFQNRGLPLDAFRRLMDLAQTLSTTADPFDELARRFPDSPQAEAASHLRTILSLLQDSGLTLRFDPSLVRGFDYYTGPVYEIRAVGREDIGSIAGGGRYDNLVGLFGGDPTPAAGISFGIERLMDIIESDPDLRTRLLPSTPRVFVVSTSAADGLRIAHRLRLAGIPAESDLSGRSFRKQLQIASERGYTWALIAGDNEIRSGRFGLKRLSDGTQTDLDLETAVATIRRHLP